jgi:hypothetical protein
VLVRGSELDGEGDALRVYQHMVLRARFDAIRRIRAGLLAPFLPTRSRRPARHATSRWPRPLVAARVGSGAACATLRPRSSREGGASRSCRCRSPSLGEASPRGCRS